MQISTGLRDARLLFWSTICFAGLGANNLLLIIDDRRVLFAVLECVARPSLRVVRGGFGVLAVQRLALSVTGELIENQTTFYLLRLAAFVVIIGGNRRQEPQVTSRMARAPTAAEGRPLHSRRRP